MKTTIRLSILFAGLCFFSLGGARIASGSQATATATAAPGSSTKKASSRAAAPSAQEIADARSKGMVWANLSTHVYHKDGSPIYGTTKRGKFMTEDDAKKAGFRQANETGSAKKHAATAK